jgi:Fe-S cluster biosynthesis and repair protein YggX
VFNSGIFIERLLPLIVESGGSVGLKFHGLPPEMTPEIYNSILGQPDAWEHFSKALSLIIDRHALNRPVHEKGQVVAMNRVVLDNYITPQGEAALLPAEEWAHKNNCAMVLAGDIPSQKFRNSFDFIDPEEFAWIILQARFRNWLRGWIAPGRAHLVSECEQKYGLRITDGIAQEGGEVRGNVHGCVGEVEPFMDIRALHGEELTAAIVKAWSIRRQWISEGCMPRFNALSAIGFSAKRAAELYIAPVNQDSIANSENSFETSLNRFSQCYGHI